VHDGGHIGSLVENFLSTQQQSVLNYFKQVKILIYDEIAFNNFYEHTAMSQTAVTFLDTIDADIFLPIYEKEHMIAYIIVERHDRPNRFYGNIEHDEMLVFASYLGNIINLLQTRNLKMLMQQEKELKAEIYHKHQEINQYKESIRSFLRTQHKEIGIIFYKNRHFSFGNKAAKELVQINVNTQEGHPLTKTLKQVARQVEEYKAPYIGYAHDKEGNKLVLSGVPNLEQNTVIITVYHPEVSDIIKRQIDVLHDPSKWDYLLYLETTNSGKLINQLIPGSGEKLLNFKISLLKLALSKKEILLDMPEEDLIPTVEIIHHISLRERLHIIKLHSPSYNHDTAIKLFGINPLFGMNATSKPLLEQLNDMGTLFIQNIHFLDLETQEYIAEFMRYGLYRIFKSDQKMASNVRIICSSNQNLQTLVHEGTFSAALFNELKKSTLSMPSLLTLAEDELNTLTSGFMEQVIKTQDLKNLLELTDKEKIKLAHQRPVSLHEFKEKIQQLLVSKSKKNQIYNDTEFDPAYQLSDPLLIEAARLGKHALRDPKIMAMLWDKLKSQAKIATFLGVNRSSVNRRCKDFKLG
jgi:transcriptional regulator of aromatic amino acid metabolism